MHRRLRTGCSAHTCQPHFHGRLGITVNQLDHVGGMAEFIQKMGNRRLPVGTERPGDPKNLVPILY